MGGRADENRIDGVLIYLMVGEELLPVKGKSVSGALILHIILPDMLSLAFDRLLRRMGKIKDGDYYLDL